MMAVHGAQTTVHFHTNGREALEAATARARNTTIVIGGDQQNGALLLDIDVQGDVCRDAKELREQLLLVCEALEGLDLDVALAPEPDRCGNCGHAPHSKLPFCPNMASDNDCNCPGGQ